MKTVLAVAFLVLAHPALAAGAATASKAVVSKSQEQAYNQTYQSDKARGETTEIRQGSIVQHRVDKAKGAREAPPTPGRRE